MPSMSGSVEAGSLVGTNKASPRAWYMLLLLSLIYIIGTVDRVVLSVIVEPLKEEFSLSDAQLGFLTGFAYSIPYALAVLPSGWLIDRVNRCVLLSIAASLWSVLTMTGALAQSYLFLVIARMGVGAAEAPASPGSLSLISDSFPKQRRATAISLYYAGTASGQIVTFLLGGILLLYFDWRALFLIAGAPGLILAALLFFTCGEPERGRFDEGAASEPVSYREAVSKAWRLRSLRHAIIGNMMSTGVSYVIVVWTVSFLVRIHGLTVEYAAITVGFVVGILMLVGSLAAGLVTDWFAKGNAARTPLVPALGCIMGAGVGVIMVLLPTLDAALVALGAFAFLMGINTGPGYASVVAMTAANMRGAILAIAKVASILIGNGGLVWLTGAMSDWIGGDQSIRWALLITILFLVWASLHFFLAARAKRLEDGFEKPETS